MQVTAAQSKPWRTLSDERDACFPFLGGISGNGLIHRLCGCIGASANDIGTDWWKSRRSAKAIATPLAAGLAVSLEKFANKCAEQIADNDLYRSSDGYAGTAHGVLPKLEEFPPQLNWEALDPELLSRSLSLTNELEIGDRMIAFWEEIDRDPALVRTACDTQAGFLGYRAWQIVVDLRSRYKLPVLEPEVFSWYRVKTLKKQHDREMARIRKHQQDKVSG